MQNTRKSSQILMKIEFSWRIFEKYQISWKSFHWETISFFHADGQTDVMNLIAAFPNFVKAPKKIKSEQQVVAVHCGIA